MRRSEKKGQRPREQRETRPSRAKTSTRPSPTTPKASILIQIWSNPTATEHWRISKKKVNEHALRTPEMFGRLLEGHQHR